MHHQDLDHENDNDHNHATKEDHTHNTKSELGTKKATQEMDFSPH